MGTPSPNPGIYRFRARMQEPAGRPASPRIPAPASALWSHPCVAISSTRATTRYQNRTKYANQSGKNSSPHQCCLYYGSELTSRHFIAWCEERKIQLIHIQPGRPMQNAHVESFNGRLRDECLKANWFPTLQNARAKITAGGMSTMANVPTAAWVDARRMSLLRSGILNYDWLKESRQVSGKQC